MSAELAIEKRNANGMTQEKLASICNVSRQSVSKWEADIALPETDKLLILGRLFHVSMGVLLKDELVGIGERMRVLLTSAGLEPEEIQKYFMDMIGKDMVFVKALFIPTASVREVLFL